MKNKGITLISLVVTVIIMLILAGIIVSISVGNNGIITKASETKSLQENAVQQSAATISNMEDKIELYTTGKLPGEMFASDIANDAENAYGKYVTNYNPSGNEFIKDGQEGEYWRILYAGKLNSDETENHIYLIASNFIGIRRNANCNNK